jgi:hypothetical protein
MAVPPFNRSLTRKGTAPRAVGATTHAPLRQRAVPAAPAAPAPRPAPRTLPADRLVGSQKRQGFVEIQELRPFLPPPAADAYRRRPVIGPTSASVEERALYSGLGGPYAPGEKGFDEGRRTIDSLRKKVLAAKSGDAASALTFWRSINTLLHEFAHDCHNQEISTKGLHPDTLTSFLMLDRTPTAPHPMVLRTLVLELMHHDSPGLRRDRYQDWMSMAFGYAARYREPKD